MTVKQMIKKAKIIFAYVMIGEHEGQYIKICKSNLLLVVKNSEYDKDKFIMRGEDLYVN
jgi:hypothetical protein